MCDEEPPQKRENHFPTMYGIRQEASMAPLPGRRPVSGQACGRQGKGGPPAPQPFRIGGEYDSTTGRRAARWGRGYFGEPAFTFRVSGSMSRR